MLFYGREPASATPAIGMTGTVTRTIIVTDLMVASVRITPIKIFHHHMLSKSFQLLKRLTTVCLLLLIGARSPAEDSKPQTKMNLSPDGKFNITTGKDDQLGVVYQLVAVSSGNVVLSLRSSYQPDTAGQLDWALSAANEANIYWRPDSLAFAVGEASIHNGGTVLVGYITSATTALQLTVPYEQLIKISGERWNIVRLGVGSDTGRDNSGNLQLVLVGTAFIDKFDTTNNTTAQVGCNVTLAIAPSLQISSVLNGGS